MQRAWDVLGLPVLALDSGDEIGAVRDILCDPAWRVVGFLLLEDGWFRAGRYIPLENVRSLGEDFLTVKGADAVVSTRVLAGLHTVGFASGKDKLKGKPVVTARGKLLGRVEEVYFSANWEKLVGYELSDGWLTDLLQGRQRLPAHAPYVPGPSLIVPDSALIQA